MNSSLLFIGAGIGVTVGDVLLCNWVRQNNNLFLFLGLLFNVIGILFYAQTLRFESIGVATSIFLAINIVAVTLAGLVLFGERISWSQGSGILMVIISIILMEI
ncbi:EamA family transporter [Candidatus Woesearchaeota archaeon]|nr:EamA family transporter [Candidatus Woesearchaeota archaeon]